MNHRCIYTYFVLALLLTGCAQHRSPQTPAEPQVNERPPMIIIRGVRPPDPADEAFRDISRYPEFSEGMLLNELAQLDSGNQTSPYIDLKRLVLLWILGKPETAGRVEVLMNQLSDHPDARISAIVGVLGRSVTVQRRSSERTAQLEAKLLEAQRRIDQLGAKIQALKALEKDLLSRPESKGDTATGTPSAR